MKVYFTVVDGNLYAHSNFVTQGHSNPTKIATTQRTDLLNLVANLYADRRIDFSDQLKLEKALEEDVELIMDSRAVRDFDRSLHREITDQQALYAKHRAAKEKRAREAAEAAKRKRLAEEARAREAAAKAERERKAAEALRARQRSERGEHFDGYLRRDAERESRLGALRGAQRGTLAKYAEADVRLFAVNRLPMGYEIQLADGSVFLSKGDVAKLKSGTPLGPSTRLDRAIAESGDRPLLLYTEHLKESEVREVDNLVFGLQKAYPKATFFRDPFSDSTVQTANTLAQFQIADPGSVVTLIAGDSFDVTDWNINKNLVPGLKGFPHTHVLEAGAFPSWDGGTGKSVIVITGHIDEKLASFIEELGTKGYFKGNYVLLNTCRETPTRSLASRVIQAHGALGTFTYDSKIDGGAVENSLFELLDRIKSGEQRSFVETVKEILHRHSLNGIWTICMETMKSRPRKIA
ncbi:MAG: hypothetical protein AAF682_00150 [Planctomycetota bacterium]